MNSYTVYQNVELSMMLSGMPRSEQKQNIPEYIEMVDMTAYTKTKASSFPADRSSGCHRPGAGKERPGYRGGRTDGKSGQCSAEKVMETLHRISKDRLVVIVTHNYEQAAPYVTRKITMHDGRIIEDKKIQPRQGTFPMRRWNPIFIRRKNERKKKRRSLAAAEEP